MQFHRLCLALLLLACGLHADHATAQTDTTGAGPAEPIDAIVVTGRRDLDDRFRSSATRININRRDIEAMGANSIGDILRQTPGLQVTTTASGGVEIRMRGMGAENTRILVDGVAVSATNRNMQLPLDEFPADLIERIEVIRAPTAEFQGASGGTLNIVLRGASPRKETILRMFNQYAWGKAAPLLFVSQTGPLGTPAAKPSASITAGGKPALAAPDSNWSYFLSFNVGERNLGSDTHRDTSTNAAATTRSAIEDEQRLRNQFWTLTPRITGRLGASDRVTLRGIFSGLDQDGRVLSNTTGLSGGAPLAGNSQNPWRYERSFYQGAVDWSHSFRQGKWDNTLQLERSDSDYRADRSGVSTLGGVTTATGSVYNENRAERGLIGKSKLDLWLGESVLSFGGDLELRKLDTGSELIGGGAPLSLESATRRKALWTQYETSAEAIKTSMTFGLRAQEFGADTVSAATTSKYQNIGWQPSVNTRTALSENLQYRFNLARISRNPRVWELAPLSQPNLSTNSPNAPDYLGNPGLRPESTITLDTGLEKRLTGGRQTGVNLFVRQQSDVIRRRLFLSGTRWVEQPDNIGDARVWGIETDVRTHLAWAGLPRDWTLNANASLLNSRLQGGTASGQHIPGQARYLANLNIAKPLRASGGWYGGGTLAMVGASDLNTPGAPGVEISGRQRTHAQLDLHIGSVIPKLGFWRLNVYNLTDYRQERGRVIANSLNGTVFTEHSERTLTPRWFLTLGTRF